MYDYTFKTNPINDLLKEMNSLFVAPQWETYKAYNPEEYDLVPKKGYIEKQIQQIKNEKVAEKEKLNQITIRSNDYIKQLDGQIAELKKKL